jgi:hypothetical protein
MEALARLLWDGQQLGRHSSEGLAYRVYNVGPSGSVRVSDTVEGPSSVLEEPPATDSDAGCSLSVRRDANTLPATLPLGLAASVVLLGRLARRCARRHD